MFWMGLQVQTITAPVSDEQGFRPVRRPLEVCPQEQGGTVVKLLRENIRPGMRLVDGVWFYSARWL